MSVTASIGCLAVVGFSAGGSCISSMHSRSGIGYTARSMYFNLTRQDSAGDCCSLCASVAKCEVWTYHMGSKACTMAAEPTVHHGLNDTISGSKLAPPFPPAPPAPPAPPQPSQGCAATPASASAKTGSPNIVLFLQDDMDLLLGGWTPMTKAKRVLSDEGATAKNWFIHTPVYVIHR